MRLSRFIELNLEEILAAWDSFARELSPTTDDMDVDALRDHAKQILEAVAKDIETPQTAHEQARKSKGFAPAGNLGESAASLHGSDRQRRKFSTMQLAAEYRALRATVMRLWLPQVGDASVIIDDLVRFNEAIDQAIAESIVTFSGKAESARDLFLATLGHDLRAPLASISASGQMLCHPNVSIEQAARAGARVSKAADLMSTMVDDLADYTRSQLGSGLQLARQAVNLRDTCSAAVEHARSMRPDARFDIDLEGDLEGLFDETRIHRLLTNLLTNAAQHGDGVAPVVLYARGNEECVVVTVANEGAPIPKDRFEAIFEPMIQLRAQAETQPRRGMGLGLYIARLVAEAHGGSISVSSEEGEPTVFSACLPKNST